jgi:hypothetical protein
VLLLFSTGAAIGTALLLVLLGVIIAVVFGLQGK